MNRTLFSAVGIAHKILLDCKNKLQSIKDALPAVHQQEKVEQRKEVINLLRKVSNIFNPNIQQEVDVKYKVAGLLLMADLYCYLGYIAGTPKSALKAINEAFKALDSAKKIIKDLDFSEVDLKLICQFNTFEIADPDDALELIQSKLLPELSAATEDKPFFQIVTHEISQPQI
ncbi:hypothetical protein [Legionella israelensis]|uniref:Uncharacterized protein n=1 Tax=Legionella israelensis TaxID=454 RepID=A0A0W0V486_9GAMM|nr:hypothetical protein [Legionella israelensis]KTD14936.1 hypothetical protein Lisr_2281 [Legionella israelensis]QBS09599.1 hypothetical protein E4T55_06835 [Legionella israelensis]SCY23993.1 hypothetical protein SAMN02746069_01754 [Legionella israelensis DSM 19235]STX60523.1 Uncharacterised protein [Legionella israelensis]